MPGRKKVAGNYPIAGNYEIGGNYPIAGNYSVGGEYDDDDEYDGGNIFDDIWGGIKDGVGAVANVAQQVAPIIAPLAPLLLGAGAYDEKDIHTMGRLHRIEKAMGLPAYTMAHHKKFMDALRKEHAPKKRKGGDAPVFLGRTTNSKPPRQVRLLANQMY